MSTLAKRRPEERLPYLLGDTSTLTSARLKTITNLLLDYHGRPIYFSSGSKTRNRSSYR